MQPKQVRVFHGVRVGQSLLFATAVAGVLHSQEPTPSVALEQSRPDEPRLRNQSVSVSGEFILGNGNITLPVGFALSGPDIGRSVQAPLRESVYYGGGLTWQITPTWGVDFSYSKGSSTGEFQFFPEAGGGRWPDAPINSTFTLDDTWYQGYVRYRFGGNGGWFATSRLGLYLRGGVTYVDADYQGVSLEDGPFYRNIGTFKDLTGNLGFGLDYRLFKIGKSFRARAVLEGEGFAGVRRREFTETTIPFSGSNSMDNLIYGGLGRLMLRADYTFGSDGQWKLLLDGGVFTRWTLEDYSQPDIVYDASQLPTSAQTDLLWGPFVRAGIRLSF